MNQIELAWAAGFFDGEGYTGCQLVHAGKSECTRLVVEICQMRDRGVLDRFRTAVGSIGVVSDTKRRPGVWRYRTEGFEETQAVIAMLWKYLSPVKRWQAKAAFLYYSSYPHRRPRYANHRLDRKEGSMKRLILALLVVVGFPTLASAQGVGITAVNFRQYLVGGVTPVSGPFTVPIASVTCNQASPVTAPPASLIWNDPPNVGRVCMYVDPGTGPLFATVYGALEGTLTNLAGALESPESVRAPFSSPPVAPLTLRVRRQ